jgi:hypothetical protein
MKHATWFIAVSLLGAGCREPGEPRPVSSRVISSPAEIVLSVGVEVRVDSLLRLGFVGVPADSRCPASVVCVWAGDGAAEIAYGLGMGPSYPDTLHTTIDPRTAEFAGYLITLLDLMPYPSTPGPIALDEYAVRLRIERR